MDKNEIMRFFTKKNSPVVSVVIFFIFYVKKERNLITDYYFNHFSDMNLAFWLGRYTDWVQVGRYNMVNIANM